MQITITDLEIEEWSVNLIQEKVTVKYLLKDSDGIIWIRDTAVFWRVIPVIYEEPGVPAPTPDYWYLLPNDYVLYLNEIKNHAETILTNKFL